MSEDAFRFCDELGPESTLHIHRAGVGLKAIVVVDNTAAGFIINFANILLRFFVGQFATAQGFTP